MRANSFHFTQPSTRASKTATANPATSQRTLAPRLDQPLRAGPALDGRVVSRFSETGVPREVWDRMTRTSVDHSSAIGLTSEETRPNGVRPRYTVIHPKGRPGEPLAIAQGYIVEGLDMATLTGGILGTLHRTGDAIYQKTGLGRRALASRFRTFVVNNSFWGDHGMLYFAPGVDPAEVLPVLLKTIRAAARAENCEAILMPQNLESPYRTVLPAVNLWQVGADANGRGGHLERAKFLRLPSFPDHVLDLSGFRTGADYPLLGQYPPVYDGQAYESGKIPAEAPLIETYSALDNMAAHYQAIDEWLGRVLAHFQLPPRTERHTIDWGALAKKDSSALQGFLESFPSLDGPWGRQRTARIPGFQPTFRGIMRDFDDHAFRAGLDLLEIRRILINRRTEIAIRNSQMAGLEVVQREQEIAERTAQKEAAALTKEGLRETVLRFSETIGPMAGSETRLFALFGETSGVLEHPSFLSLLTAIEKVLDSQGRFDRLANAFVERCRTLPNPQPGRKQVEAWITARMKRDVNATTKARARFATVPDAELESLFEAAQERENLRTAIQTPFQTFLRSFPFEGDANEANGILRMLDGYVQRRRTCRDILLAWSTDPNFRREAIALAEIEADIRRLQRQLEDRRRKASDALIKELELIPSQVDADLENRKRRAAENFERERTRYREQIAAQRPGLTAQFAAEARRLFQHQTLDRSTLEWAVRDYVEARLNGLVEPLTRPLEIGLDEGVFASEAGMSTVYEHYLNSRRKSGLKWDLMPPDFLPRLRKHAGHQMLTPEQYDRLRSSEVGVGDLSSIQTPGGLRYQLPWVQVLSLREKGAETPISEVIWMGNGYAAHNKRFGQPTDDVSPFSAYFNLIRIATGFGINRGHQLLRMGPTSSSTKVPKLSLSDIQTFNYVQFRDGNSGLLAFFMENMARLSAAGAHLDQIGTAARRTEADLDRWLTERHRGKSIDRVFPFPI